MKKKVKIISNKIIEGVNERGEWRMNEMHVKWEEGGEGGTDPYEQETVLTVSGFVQHGKLKSAIELNADVPVTMYFGVRTYNDRKFVRVSGYLPKEFMAETKEKADDDKPF